VATPTELSQRRIGLRIRFEVGEDALQYSMKDYSGERTFEIPYENINLTQPAFLTLTATPLFRRLFGLALLFLLFAAALGAFMPDLAVLCGLATLPLSLTIIVGRLTGWTNIHFRLFQLQPATPGAINPIRVIDDAKGEQIVDLIKQARKAKFRRLYAEPNLDTDPEREISRLTWLRDNDIITSEEWQAAIDWVRDSSREDSPIKQVTDQMKPDSIH
jgi:hypothetical protein